MTEPTTTKSNNVFHFNNDTGTTPKRTFSLLKSVIKKKLSQKVNLENFVFTVYMKQSVYLTQAVKILSWFQLGLLGNGLCEKTLENCVDLMKVSYFYFHVHFFSQQVLINISKHDKLSVDSMHNSNLIFLPLRSMCLEAFYFLLFGKVRI